MLLDTCSLIPFQFCSSLNSEQQYKSIPTLFYNYHKLKLCLFECDNLIIVFICIYLITHEVNSFNVYCFLVISPSVDYLFLPFSHFSIWFLLICVNFVCCR